MPPSPRPPPLSSARANAATDRAASPATTPAPVPEGVPQLEQLDRGPRRRLTTEGVFLSWRLLGYEVTGATDHRTDRPGLRRLPRRPAIATVTDSTNYADAAGTATAPATRWPPSSAASSSTAPRAVTPWAQALHRPAAAQTRRRGHAGHPAGEAYTYSANDVLGRRRRRRRRSTSTSSSGTRRTPRTCRQRGYTGNVYIDAYALDGTLLPASTWASTSAPARTTRSSSSTTSTATARSEMMMKTAPGTQIITYGADGSVASERVHHAAEAGRRRGHAHTDDYRMSAADYFEHLVEMFEGWTEHPEVVAGHWPATLEQALGIPPAHDYPLSGGRRRGARQLLRRRVRPEPQQQQQAARLRGLHRRRARVPHGVRRRHRQGAADHPVQARPRRRRPAVGRLRDVPHRAGQPRRPVPVGVAYLDGQHPSAVFARGYYTRTTIVAYDWNGRRCRSAGTSTAATCR